ncbi:MAG: hypothetical protein WC813_01600 [Patescibacteria group bacterium]|jgi:hypothetical protein
MPEGMGSPERKLFDPAKKVENKASFAAMNKELGVRPAVEAAGRWKKVDRSEKKAEVVPVQELAQDSLSEDDIGTDEQELAVENKENEADALLDQWVDYLSDPGVSMMSESGKVLVDVQKLYDLGLTEKSLGDIRKKAAARSAPVKRDVYGQAGQEKAA